MNKFNSLAISMLALTAAHAFAQAEIAPPQAPAPATTLTRAQVQADYLIARESGLADLLQREVTVDRDSAQYRAAYAKYVQLLDSPKYAQLVARLDRGSR